MERKVKFKIPELQAVYDEVRDYFIRNKFKIARLEQVNGKPCLTIYETYRLWEEAPGDVRWERVSRNTGERDSWTWEPSGKSLGRIYLSPSDLSGYAYDLKEAAIGLACKKLGLDWIKLSRFRAEIMKLELICEQGLVFGYRVKHLRAAKYLTKLLWNEVLSKEALTLASKVHGRASEVNLSTYLFVRRNESVLRQLAAEAPNLLPVLADSTNGSTPLTHDAFGKVRQDKFESGVTPAMWRWLTKQTLMVVKEMLKNQGLWKLLASTTERAPYSVVAALSSSRLGRTLDHGQLIAYHDEQTAPRAQQAGTLGRGSGQDSAWDNLVLFMRLALREARVRKGRLKPFVNTELLLAADWIAESMRDASRLRPAYVFPRGDRGKPKAIETLPINLGWAGVMRRQHEWHEKAALGEVSGPGKSWESLIPVQTVDGFEVKPLLSSLDLVQEGRLLHHCVATYDLACASGQSRVFSMAGQERATIELARHGDKWQVAQVRSYCNKPVSDAASKAAKKVAGLYQVAWAKHLKGQEASGVMSEDFSGNFRQAA